MRGKEMMKSIQDNWEVDAVKDIREKLYEALHAKIISEDKLKGFGAIKC
jgi:hypothetical protein